jgi:hypothetical protein
MPLAFIGLSRVAAIGYPLHESKWGSMAKQLQWRDAIIEVLKSSTEAMHYARIAQEISDRGLRDKLGATPANTVNVTLSDSIRDEGADSPFDRTARGEYRLKESVKAESQVGLGVRVATNGSDGLRLPKGARDDEPEEPTGLINALGMYWSRDKVDWEKGTPKLLGRQAASDESVDFSEQRGVYLLYDRNEVIYVGRATDQGLGTRLRQHTVDRLNGRWDRFSWFGIDAVSERGKLKGENRSFNATMLIATMEALLIESVEPSQNRKRGDDFTAIEFLQTEDPAIKRKKDEDAIAALLRGR